MNKRNRNALCTKESKLYSICSYLYSPHISSSQCMHAARHCQPYSHGVSKRRTWQRRQPAHSVQTTNWLSEWYSWLRTLDVEAYEQRAHWNAGCAPLLYYASIVRREAIIKRFWEGIRMYTINKLLSWWYYTDAIWIYYTLLLRSQLLYWPRV